MTGPAQGSHAVERIAPLDALRGLAILMVLLVHCFWVMPLSGPSTLVKQLQPGMLLGVDLFFVLSGYLITGILLRTRGHGGYFRGFYIRRVLRILPAYYFVIALIWLALPQVDASVRGSRLHDYTLWYVLHVQNWLMAQGISGGWPGVNHFWSLAVEEQFYLVWPLLVLATPPQALRRLCLVLFAVCCASKLALVAAHADWVMLYMGTMTRYDGLIAGALIATLRPEEALARAHTAGVVGLAAGLGIVGIVATSPSEHTSPRIALETTLAAIAFGAAVLRVHARAPAWSGALLQSRALMWLGRYSYGIYLLHLPLVFLVRPWAARQGVLTGVPVNLRSFLLGLATVAIALLLARLMYQFLEEPALNLRHRLAPDPQSPTEPA